MHACTHTHLTNAFIFALRNGEVIDRALLKTIIRMLCDLQVRWHGSHDLLLHTCDQYVIGVPGDV